MYKYVLNLVIKMSLMFAQYFEYYAIILRGAVFLCTGVLNPDTVLSREQTRYMLKFIFSGLRQVNK